MAGSIGVLLLQTGTPDAPTPRAVRRYLRRFLSDPRLIEVPRPIWWVILNGFILPIRSRKSAEKYRTIWDAKTGSPLLYYTRQQAEKLQAALPSQFVVRFAMRYSAPFIPDVIKDLAANGVGRILMFPLYPQYSATTTASVLDGVFQSLMGMRSMPAIRVVPPYYGHSGYVQAVARGIQAALEQGGTLDRLILSFHGIPKAYAERGDPYPRQCRETFDSIRQHLALPPGQIVMTFQSRFGPQEWLTPYTDKTLEELGRQGCKHVWIAAPGFTADCLETIEELGITGSEQFKRAGGETLHRIPCLNDHPAWIEAMQAMVREQTAGWS